MNEANIVDRPSVLNDLLLGIKHQAGMIALARTAEQKDQRTYWSHSFLADSFLPAAQIDIF